MGGDLVVSYEPANSFETPRFSGVRTFMRLPNVQDLENADAAIVGAPFDTGASFRAGARFGPEGIRSISHLLRPYNPSQDVSIFEYLSVYDLPVYVEETLTEDEIIVFRAGTHTDTMSVGYADFERLVEPAVAELARRELG